MKTITVKKKAFDTTWYLSVIVLYTYIAYKHITELPFKVPWVNHLFTAFIFGVIFWVIYALFVTLFTKVKE